MSYDLGKTAATVIVGFFSSFIFNILKQQPNQLELSLLIIVIFFIWLVIYIKVKNSIDTIKFLQNSKDLTDVIEELMYFVTALGSFLVFQILLDFLLDSFGVNTPTTFELIALVFTGLAVIYYIIQIQKNFKRF